MAFCTRCGVSLVEGETHECTAQTAAAQTAATQAVVQGGSNVDFQRILALIKNPLLGTKLSEQSDMIYGILGFAATVLGVFIWVLGMFHNVTAGISGLPFVGQAISPNYISTFFFGILLVVLPSGSLYLFSNWQGQQKQSFKQAVTTLGATQWLAGVGFLVAAILSYMSIAISVGGFLIVYEVDIILLVLACMDLFVVSEQKRTFVITLAIIVCTIIGEQIGEHYITSVVKDIGSSVDGIQSLLRGL